MNKQREMTSELQAFGDFYMTPSPLGRNQCCEMADISVIFHWVLMNNNS